MQSLKRLWQREDGLECADIEATLDQRELLERR